MFCSGAVTPVTGCVNSITVGGISLQLRGDSFVSWEFMTYYDLIHSSAELKEGSRLQGEKIFKGA